MGSTEVAEKADKHVVVRELRLPQSLQCQASI